ncbi:MAG: DUF6502 family protein [Pseudomonadota bacterium]
MASDDSDRFLRVLRGLIRPLVRVLIARGVTAPAFYRLLKSVYVDVADQSFRLEDGAPTDSRISLLTGVHRRDVKILRAAGDDGWEAARAKSAAFATVLSRWRAAGSDPLPRAAFDTLVIDVSTDIRPRTVLDELLRQGLIVADGDLLRLTDAALAGPRADDHRLVFFAANLGDHLAAAAENLLAEDPPYLERAVFYTRLTPEAVDALEARARELGQDLLVTLDAESRVAQEAGKMDPANTERYRFGLYFYREGADNR